MAAALNGLQCPTTQVDFHLSAVSTEPHNTVYLTSTAIQPVQPLAQPKVPKTPQ